MRRVLLFPIIAVCGLVGFSPAATAAVPLLNGTCPGNIEVHADQGGPVYINGRETTLKSFNENYYEARDAQSDVTVSISRKPDGGVDLSYTGNGGANGVCTVTGTGGQAGGSQGHADAMSGTSSATEVTCESRGKEQAECSMDTRGEVKLVRQLSHSSCVEGQSWGLNRHSVWVREGCRAVFRNTSHDRHGSVGTAHASRGGVLLGACNLRADADGALVTRVPVNDTVDELIVDYPDGRYLCMVTKEGQVQSLTRLKAR